MAHDEVGGAGLPQERRIVTAIPVCAGWSRRKRAVAPGVASSMPAYVVAAGGGILRDADGNQISIWAPGIAVTTVGNANPRVVTARRRSDSRRSPLLRASW